MRYSAVIGLANQNVPRRRIGQQLTPAQQRLMIAKRIVTPPLDRINGTRQLLSTIQRVNGGRQRLMVITHSAEHIEYRPAISSLQPFDNRTVIHILWFMT